MSGLADAQLEWEESEARMGKPSRSFSEPPDSLRNNTSCSGYHVRIVAMFGLSFQFLLMSLDIYADRAKIDLYPSVEIPISEAETSYTIALVRYGLMPCSPTTPSVAITTRTLEFHCVLCYDHPSNQYSLLSKFCATSMAMHLNDIFPLNSPLPTTSILPFVVTLQFGFKKRWVETRQIIV